MVAAHSDTMEFNSTLRRMTAHKGIGVLTQAFYFITDLTIMFLSYFLSMFIQLLTFYDTQLYGAAQK